MLSHPPRSSPPPRLLWLFLGSLLTSLALGADVQVRNYFGLCDASAAVWLNPQAFAVADDEDSVIRVYSRADAGAPLLSVDLSDFLKVDPNEPEVDLEGAASVGDLSFWISSHGRSAKGKERLSRHRFFATRTIVEKGVPTLGPAGSPYTRLLEDFSSDSRLKRFQLAAAAALPPKAPGGLNIEGLAATPGGHLLIGFRNPVPMGQALLVPLLNPTQIVAGVSAKLGDPILLPLGGLGIRSITEWRGSYLIVAGSIDGEGQSVFYRWPGAGHLPERLSIRGVNRLNPEALAADSDSQRTDLLVISDDGNVMVGKKPCKKLKQAKEKRFRAAILPDFAP